MSIYQVRVILKSGYTVNHNFVCIEDGLLEYLNLLGSKRLEEIHLIFIPNYEAENRPTDR